MHIFQSTLNLSQFSQENVSLLCRLALHQSKVTNLITSMWPVCDGLICPMLFTQNAHTKMNTRTSPLLSNNSFPSSHSHSQDYKKSIYFLRKCLLINSLAAAGCLAWGVPGPLLRNGPVRQTPCSMVKRESEEPFSTLFPTCEWETENERTCFFPSLQTSISTNPITMMVVLLKCP